jgi:hypothetical protein
MRAGATRESLTESTVASPTGCSAKTVLKAADRLPFTGQYAAVPVGVANPKPNL